MLARPVVVALVILWMMITGVVMDFVSLVASIGRGALGGLTFTNKGRRTVWRSCIFCPREGSSERDFKGRRIV